MMEYKRYTLHRVSALFSLADTVKGSLIVGIVTFFNDAMPTSLKYVVAVVFFMALVYSMVSIKFYSFKLKEDELEINEGIFFKNNRKIPYLRIQNVNSNQNPIHTFFNVATLQLESASGGDEEALMRVIDIDLVQKIKEKVHMAHLNGSLDLEKEEDPLIEVKTSDLLRYGIVSQKGMFFGAIIFGFLLQYEKYVIQIASYLGEMYGIPDFSKVTLLEGVIYVSLSAVIVFLLLQFLSLLWSFVKFYKFKILKDKDRIQATMGFLSKKSAIIPLKRIQLYRVNANPIHRYFKGKTIEIETAGASNKGSGSMRWLAPFILASKAESLIKELEPKIKIDSIDWNLIPHRAWKRVLARLWIALVVFMIGLLLIALIPKIEIRYYTWMVFVLMLPMTYFYAKSYVKKTAYFYNAEVIGFKSGVWLREESYVKIDKIQSIEIKESPFDRRNNMVTLEVDTAGSNTLLHHVRIPYLERDEAYKIRDFIQTKVKKVALVW